MVLDLVQEVVEPENVEKNSDRQVNSAPGPKREDDNVVHFVKENVLLVYLLEEPTDVDERSGALHQHEVACPVS